MRPSSGADRADRSLNPSSGSATGRSRAPDVPSGALLVRVWREGGPGDPVKARILGRHGLERAQGVAPDYAVGIDDIVAVVRAWLVAFEEKSQVS
jgi:hypothetical protein